MSCLFNSLSYLLKEELLQKNITNLRSYICDYMQNNYDEMLKNDKIKDWLINICIDRYNENDLEENIIKTYINDMRKNSTWGGAPEIAIASKLFNVNIIVNYENNHTMEFTNSNFNPNHILHLNWSCGHYTPITKNKN